LNPFSISAGSDYLCTKLTEDPKKSVLNNLEKFHEYLENSVPTRGNTIVSHAIQIFSNLRALLGDQADGVHSLRAFLYLLASVTDKQDEVDINVWRLNENVFDIVNKIYPDDWLVLKEKFIKGKLLDNLIPNFPLMLRHASGVLFQEAHREVTLYNQQHLRIGGFLPTPSTVSAETKGIGIHFTPPALARNMVEEAMYRIEDSPSICIFDPACGSGEFLRESLRLLELKSYLGDIKIIGWDVSEAACDMAEFILAWEARHLQNHVDVDIQCINSLDPEVNWPSDVDIILMNPPFVAWPNMTPEQKDFVQEALGNAVKNRIDMSYAFLWKAINSLRLGGVLGTVLPASFLDSKSAETLREQASAASTDQIGMRSIAQL
jgi:adenine-specific DNA-methyltransferase